MPFYTVRTFLYWWFFAFSVILMALTAYRVRYTKSLDQPDVLTTRQHFYNPIVVELLVTAIFGTIWSIFMIFLLMTGIVTHRIFCFAMEYVALCFLFVMSLIGASIYTSQFSNVSGCRSQKVCRILETIEAFAWIFWAWISFLFFGSVLNMLRNNEGIGGRLDGRKTDTSTRPETRSAAVQSVSTSGAAVAVEPGQSAQ